jgi:Galactose oxidase, central domain/Kelch motif
MSISRTISCLGLIVSISLVGCGRSVAPTPSSISDPSTGSRPTAVAASGRSAAPSQAESVPPSQAATWLHAGDLREPRNATHAVVLGTGEVLVVGSDYLTSWLSACGASTNGSDSVEIGDPEAGNWDETSRLPSLRDAPAVVGLPDGRALLTGGAAGEDVGWSANSSTYVFDPATRAWLRSGLLNTARTLTAAAVLPDGRVLVAGGMFMDRAADDATRVLDTAELWDPGSGAWSRTGPLAQARFSAAAVTLADGRVLIVGGPASRESDPIPLFSAEVYDPASDRWTSAGALATARRGFALVPLPDGGALVAGGFGAVGTAALTRLSTVERFDPVANTWSRAGDLLFPVAGAIAVPLTDGRVLLAGGSTREPEPIDADAGTYATGLTAKAMLFDSQTGTWTETTPMPNPRAGASAVLLADGSAVIVGGSESEGEINATPGCPEAHPQVIRYVPGP